MIEKSYISYKIIYEEFFINEMSIATENSKIGVNLYREKFLKGDSSSCVLKLPS